MNKKYEFILTVAVLLTSALIIGISAAQPAEAKEKFRYCVEYFEVGITHCYRTLEECQFNREVNTELGYNSNPCEKVNHAQKLE